MLARVFSATMIGLQAIKVEVEVDSHRGIPGLIIIGLPAKTVDEAKERITSSLQHCQIRIKSHRTIVNLAPADIPKRSSHLELAIAVALLKMYGEIRHNTDDTFFCGELSLNGDLKPVRGALPLVLAAKNMGFTKVVLPAGNSREVCLIKGITIYPLHHLREFIAFAQAGNPLSKLKPSQFDSLPPVIPDISFSDIQGQLVAKRALSIMAAGGHNLLMIGPPGSGKSLLAQATAAILPPLTESEAIELTNIYSLAGLNDHQLVTQRPFRAPHHSISDVGLLGGHNLRPGEVTLAHHGILFMDEFPEFNRSGIEALRLPLEHKRIHLNRAEGQVNYPAAFSLIAAANPCRCGYFGSLKKTCHCSPHTLDVYRQKISGPILDRIDLQLTITEPDSLTIESQASAESAQTIIDRVAKARDKQRRRYYPHFTTNSQLPFNAIKTYCQISSQSERFLIRAAQSLGLSARGFFRTLKVAQTICDLEEELVIETPHVAEALRYRYEGLEKG